MRCRLPGPQLPAQTARRPVVAASAPAANAATSSCRTCIHAMRSSRRRLSLKPLRLSPVTPQMRVTPALARVVGGRSATGVIEFSGEFGAGATAHSVIAASTVWAASSKGYFRAQLEHERILDGRVGIGTDHVLNVRLDRQPVVDLRQIGCLDRGLGPVDRKSLL